MLPSRRLPEKPNLDHLRKQAKDLLADYRDSKPDAVAEVTRYERNAPDAAEFALNDAQRILARSYGFASWPKLKTFVDGANATRFLEAVRTKTSRKFAR